MHLNRWSTIILVLLLLTVMIPLVSQLQAAAPAFTTDNLLRGTMVSSFNP